MKRFIAILLLVLFFISTVSGCGERRDDQADNKSPVLQENSDEEMGNEDTDGEWNDDSLGDNMPVEPLAYAFGAQYIRTDGEDREYPYYVVIDSKEELDSYYELNKNIFDLERRETVYSDSTIGFLDACDKYDEAYFEEYNILLVILSEPSGSIRHKISEVRISRENADYIVSIERISPEVCTDDMAVWHLFVEVEMGKVIRPGDTVEIRMFDK